VDVGRATVLALDVLDVGLAPDCVDGLAAWLACGLDRERRFRLVANAAPLTAGPS